ncbi:MAG: MFS transporter [Thermoproteota archaeon]|nr:MFS transporter [Thermoproteota archaeon]
MDKNRNGMSGSKISFHAWKTLAILSGIATMVLYAETMLVPAIPHLINDFGITYSISSWILSSYLISGAISVPITGKLSDMYGRKRILLIVMTIYTLGVIGGAVSIDIYSLLFSRIIQGIGMSVFPIVFAIVQDQFPKNKVSIAQGTLASMFAFGGVLGLLVGGNVIEYFGWRMTFYSVIPVAILLIVIIWRYIRVKEEPIEKEPIQPEHKELSNKESKGADEYLSEEQRQRKLTKYIFNSGKSKIDIKGAIFLAISITSFLSALSFVQSSSDNNTDLQKSFNIPWEILLLSLVGFGSLTTFIIVERGSSSPLIDLKLVGHKPILISNIMVIIWGICTFAIFQTIPILVQSPVITGGIGGNAIDAANIQLPFSITSLVFGPTSGLIISKIGSSRVTLMGAIITTISLLSILIFHANTIQLAVNLAVVGVGLALLNVGQLNINTTSVPPKNIGVSLGINTLLRYVGSAIGPAIAGMLMQSNQNIIKTADGILRAFPSKESYNFIFLFLLVAVAITILLSMQIAHRKIGQTTMEKQR